MFRTPFTRSTAVALVALALPLGAQAASCDLKAVKPTNGLSAQAAPDGITVAWAGEPGTELRLQLAIAGGVPTIEELALRKGQGTWTPLLAKVTPEFTVVTGLRRISNQQLAP